MAYIVLLWRHRGREIPLGTLPCSRDHRRSLVVKLCQSVGFLVNIWAFLCSQTTALLQAFLSYVILSLRLPLVWSLLCALQIWRCIPDWWWELVLSHKRWDHWSYLYICLAIWPSLFRLREQAEKIWPPIEVVQESIPFRFHIIEQIPTQSGTSLLAMLHQFRVLFL